MSMDATLLARIDAPSRGLRITLAAVLSVLFFAVYGAAGYWAGMGDRPVAPHAGWELAIPLLAWTIVPYCTIDAFYVVAFLVAPTRRELSVHARRVVLTLLVAGACFVLFPMKLAWPRADVAGMFGPIFAGLFRFDGPHNLVPSLHIALLVLLVELYTRRYTGPARAAIVAWFVLICVSVFTTHQHHLIDVLTGAALGVLVAYVLPFERMPATRRVRQGFIAARYALAAAGLAVLTALLWRWSLWSTLLLWPAVGLGLCGLAYAGVAGGTRIFQKRRGRLSWQARVVFAPVLLVQTLWHALSSRRAAPWDVITDGVLVGRCPTRSDARRLLAAGVTAVLDLTCEYAETPLLLAATAYLNVPLLDMTVPSRHELHAALAFIRRHVALPGGKVYIHCALGRYRSAVIAAEYLRLRDGLTAEEAVGRLRRARRHIVIGPAELEHLRELTSRQRGQTGPNPVSSSV